MPARGPRQAQWNISAREGDREPLELWARRLAGLGLVPRNRGLMASIRIAVQLAADLDDDDLMDRVDREGETCRSS